MHKFLVIQTAFIGDAILGTAVLEKLYEHYPTAKIDYLVRKGNQGLLINHPFLNELLVLDKTNKYRNLWKMLQRIRAENYSHVINLQRFASTGFLTAFSGAKNKIGFKQNPFSVLFSHRIKHKIGNGSHEVDRNQQLIAFLTDEVASKPRLYPAKEDFEKVSTKETYICIAPSSVWFTKQYPKSKWIEFLNIIPTNYRIFLLGGPPDKSYCQEIVDSCKHTKVENKAGGLSFLESAAIMKGARMNYVNDSAPLHIASAINAPVRAVFCSTVPSFGFTPLSDNSKTLETKIALDCRPCGLHGKKSCPKGHFSCSNIEVEVLFNELPS